MSSRGHASDKMKYVPDSLRWLIAITGVLIVIGCLNIYSSTYYMDIYDGGSAYKHISNHILFLLGGIFAAWIAVKLGTNKIRQGAWLWFIAVFLLLILVKFAGISVNGANRWIMLGPMSLQPSELAKVAGIIWTAAFLAKRINNKEPITVFYGILNRPMGKRRKRRGLVHHFLPILCPAVLATIVLLQPDMGTAAIILFFPGLLYILAGMPFLEILAGIVTAVFYGILNRPMGKRRKRRGLVHHFLPILCPAVLATIVLLQPDMGTAAIILFFPGLLYILAGMPFLEILAGIVTAVCLGGYLAVVSAYRAERMAILWDPFADPLGAGYQIVRSLTAVGSGGFWGQGPGEGVYKFLYLPEQHTDFAYAVFSQEFGFIGSVVVMCLFMGFLMCGFSCARQLKQPYESLLVYGLTLLISVQGIINMAMVIGCFPVTGIPLPFISYGGTSLLTNVISVGLIWGAVISGREKSDIEERRRMIKAMEGQLAPSGRKSFNHF